MGNGKLTALAGFRIVGYSAWLFLNGKSRDVEWTTFAYIHTQCLLMQSCEMFSVGEIFNSVCRLRKPAARSVHTKLQAGALYSTTRQSTGVSDTRVVAFNSHGSLVFPK